SSRSDGVGRPGRVALHTQDKSVGCRLAVPTRSRLRLDHPPRDGEGEVYLRPIAFSAASIVASITVIRSAWSPRAAMTGAGSGWKPRTSDTKAPNLDGWAV